MRKRIISIMLAAITAASMTISASAFSVTDYKDINTTDWYYDAADYVLEKELFAGTSETTFAPSIPMTRGMFVTVLGRLAEVNPDRYTPVTFEDIPAGIYYAPYVQWAFDNGIVQGVTGSRFDPQGIITREQMSAILYRYAEKTDNSTFYRNSALNRFADSEMVSTYAEIPMKWAATQRIINGTGKDIDPKGTATRAQVAQILYNAKDVLMKNAITEDDKNPLYPEIIRAKTFGEYIYLHESIDSIITKFGIPTSAAEGKEFDTYYYGSDSDNPFAVLAADGKVIGFATCTEESEMFGLTQDGSTAEWNGDFEMLDFEGEKDRIAIGSFSMPELMSGRESTAMYFFDRSYLPSDPAFTDPNHYAGTTARYFDAVFCEILLKASNPEFELESELIEEQI